MYQDLLKIRSITGFLEVRPDDFAIGVLEDKISNVVRMLREVEKALTTAGYIVQTVRLATNPFGDWLLSIQTADEQLQRLDDCLNTNNITFCSLGPAESVIEVKEFCTKILAASSRFSCSASLAAKDVVMARAAAYCIKEIAALDTGAPHVEGGLGNFRFCVAAAAKDQIPFFPAAKAPRSKNPSFAIGLENGPLALHLLQECGSLELIDTVFREGMRGALAPIQSICERVAQTLPILYAGIDSSLNPSLATDGSVAHAMESLSEVQRFGAPGTLAVAAATTECLQSLPGIQLVGYCGLMLPLCEDQRLAELATSGSLRIHDLLSICQVCGVGIDTVPISGNVDDLGLASLLLDVAGIAYRWGKSLSCRVFPVPGKEPGDMTSFDSPYLVNCKILPLSS